MAVYIARTCMVCGYRTRLKNDDTFIKHKDKRGEHCPGSFHTPQQTHRLHIDETYEEFGVKPPTKVPPPEPPSMEDDPAFRLAYKPWWKIW